jgi:hypothetical protein
MAAEYARRSTWTCANAWISHPKGTANTLCSLGTQGRVVPVFLVQRRACADRMPHALYRQVHSPLLAYRLDTPVPA